MWRIYLIASLGAELFELREELLRFLSFHPQPFQLRLRCSRQVRVYEDAVHASPEFSHCRKSPRVVPMLIDVQRILPGFDVRPLYVRQDQRYCSILLHAGHVLLEGMFPVLVSGLGSIEGLGVLELGPGFDVESGLWEFLDKRANERLDFRCKIERRRCASHTWIKRGSGEDRGVWGR